MTSRNHIRVVAVALVSAPHAAGAGAAYLTPPQAGATGKRFYDLFHLDRRVWLNLL